MSVALPLHELHLHQVHKDILSRCCWVDEPLKYSCFFEVVCLQSLFQLFASRLTEGLKSRIFILDITSLVPYVEHNGIPNLRTGLTPFSLIPPYIHILESENNPKGDIVLFLDIDTPHHTLVGSRQLIEKLISPVPEKQEIIFCPRKSHVEHPSLLLFDLVCPVAEEDCHTPEFSSFRLVYSGYFDPLVFYEVIRFGIIEVLSQLLKEYASVCREECLKESTNLTYVFVVVVFFRIPFEDGEYLILV